MSTRAEAFFSVEEETEEGGLQKESEHAFHGQSLADHAAGVAREHRPVGAELKFHGDAGDHTHEEVDAENLRPETRGLIVGLVVAAKTEGLENDDQRGEPHGELREKIVEGDGEGEMNTMNEEGAIHT